ncbi:MAG: alpha,alpha-trehalase [Deltaproteobacteria bacterium]|nr:alpha,alpha-trehalase [Deltaproteobacteria bacterium]
MEKRPLPFRPRPCALLACLLALGCAVARGAPSGPASPRLAARAPADLSEARLGPLRAYIKSGWRRLLRTHQDIAVAARDPKVPHEDGEPWPVYHSVKEDPARLAAALAAEVPPSILQQIALRPLGEGVAPGLLYLPRPYVVPGGRFNEMYGWDSYFILLGLLRDGEVALARDMTENFLYQIEHYGRVLNANRTYYLSRSQPPFLTEMVLAVHEAAPDLDWLARAFPAVESYYKTWVREPHLVPSHGLSRYYDVGEGPAPEVVTGERDERGRTHYERVRAYFRTHAVADYEVGEFYDRARDQLTPAFYKGDRSMRESGFDPSDRFGPFGADVVSYLPVCLNALLYRMEVETAEIANLLGRAPEAAAYLERAQARRAAVDAVLWDEATGLYLDFNFQTGRRRMYPFATTFYPLWAGLASATQAKRVRANLPMFERPGGIVTSTVVSGSQWDAPFGWAPLQLLAAQGLRRYGYAEDAGRIGDKFVSLVLEVFGARGAIVEKYDVVRRSAEVGGALRFGYASNEIGFGWTNGVVLELLSVRPGRH